MTITTQPTAVSLVQLTRQLNSELSFFLTYGDNPNPNPTRDRRQSGSPNSPTKHRTRKTINAVSYSMEDDTYIHKYSTCISQPSCCTAYYSTVVHGTQLPRRNRTTASKSHRNCGGQSEGRIGLCRAGGKLSSDFVPAWRPRSCRWRCYNVVVVVTATVVASFGLCIHVCRYAETPQLNWAARWDPSDPQQNLIRPLLTMILSLIETERNSPRQVR
jgi:hypothetical protein